MRMFDKWNVMKRLKLIMVASLLFVFFSAWDNCRNAWQYLIVSGNVNKDFLAVDSVWYNPGNNYHNDTLINTILANKTCVYNPDCWYADYYEVFSLEADKEKEIPELVSGDKLSADNFDEVGYTLTYVHTTLVDHAVHDVVEKGDVPSLYINTEGISDADRVVAVNDENGNIYLMTEEFWFEICE